MQQQASSILFCPSYPSQQEQEQQMPHISEVSPLSEDASIMKNIQDPPHLNGIGTPVKGPDPKNLIVNYIPTRVTDEELRELFEPFGTLVSARVIVNRNTKNPKGYGFVKYTTEEAAKLAIAAMNGYEIENKRLRVMQANGPQNRNPTQYSDTPTHTSSVGFSYPPPGNPGGVPAGTNGLPVFPTALPGSSLGAEGEIVRTPQFLQPALLGQPCTVLGPGGAIYLSAAANQPAVMLASANSRSPSQSAYPTYYPGAGSSGLFLVELDSPAYAAASCSSLGSPHSASFAPEGLGLGGAFFVKPVCTVPALGPGVYGANASLGNRLNFAH